MRSARSAAAAVSFSLAVLLTIPHAALAQRAPAGGMSGHFGAAIGGRAGAFGFHGGRISAFGFQRGFAPNRFDGGFRSRLGAGPHLPRLGPIGFFFDGFFDGFAVFPFVDGFAFFDGFPFIDQFPFIPGFPNRRPFGFFDFGPRGLPLGAPLGFFPAFGGWGGGGYAQSLKDAIDAAGAAGQLFVAAAGNDIGNNNDVFPVYPASFDSPNIVAVAATNSPILN